MTVYKLVEVVGTSNTSFSDAVRGAVERAAQTLQDVSWFEVRELRGRVSHGRIAEFQVKADIAFLLHAADDRARVGDLHRYEQPRTRATRETRSVLAQGAAMKGEHRRANLAHEEGKRRATPATAARRGAKSGSGARKGEPARKTRGRAR